eukprot:128762_1
METQSLINESNQEEDDDHPFTTTQNKSSTDSLRYKPILFLVITFLIALSIGFIFGFSSTSSNIISPNPNTNDIPNNSIPTKTFSMVTTSNIISITTSKPSSPPTHSYLHLYHICIDGNGIYSPLPYNYYHHYYSQALLNDFSCPQNSHITSLHHSIKHINCLQTDIEYMTYSPIQIHFIAYNIEDNPQEFGGDVFVIFAEHIANNNTKQAFKTQDLFNGTYIIHLLLSIPGTYNLFIIHKYTCYDAMVNEHNNIISNMSFHYLATITIKEFKQNINNTKWEQQECPHTQYGIDMLASGMWTENKYLWRPYCCKNVMGEYSKKFDTLNDKNTLLYIAGDSTLTGRTHSIGYPYSDREESWTIMKDDMLNKSNYNDVERVILITNINLHPVIHFKDLDVACNVSMRFLCELIYLTYIYHKDVEIDVIVESGTAIHEQLHPVGHDLVTDYRVRYHDECFRNNIEIINRIRKKEIDVMKNNYSMCYNKTIDDVVYTLTKDIYFVDISKMRASRWDRNIALRPHDKIHGFLMPTVHFYKTATYFRATEHTKMKP